MILTPRQVHNNVWKQAIPLAASPPGSIDRPKKRKVGPRTTGRSLPQLAQAMIRQRTIQALISGYKRDIRLLIVAVFNSNVHKIMDV